MKIRTHFVSNSSSSSYLIIVSEETHQKILDQLFEKDRESYLFYEDLNLRTQKLGKEEVVVLKANFSTEGNGNTINNDYFPVKDWSDYEDISQKFFSYYNLAKKQPNTIVEYESR